ncbi:hypothetical protein GCM10010378_36500 [Streptomyces viridochromogenes]
MGRAHEGVPDHADAQGWCAGPGGPCLRLGLAGLLRLSHAIVLLVVVPRWGVGASREGRAGVVACPPAGPVARPVPPRGRAAGDTGPRRRRVCLPRPPRPCPTDSPFPSGRGRLT